MTKIGSCSRRKTTPRITPGTYQHKVLCALADIGPITPAKDGTPTGLTVRRQDDALRLLRSKDLVTSYNTPTTWALTPPRSAGVRAHSPQALAATHLRDLRPVAAHQPPHPARPV